MGPRVTSSRQAALRTLQRVRGGELADRALDAELEGLPERDRAWVYELVYGTFRLRGRLDHWLGELVRQGLDALEADVLDVLRLGAYQLREMGSVPPYAAVSQSVELARDAGLARASGLVNGVLQALRRRGDEIRFPDREREPVEYLSTWGSHPRWMVQRWVDRWGVEAAVRLVDANNRRPELYVRTVGVSVEEATAELRSRGIEVEAVAFSPSSLRVVPPATPGEVLATVSSVVQDPAAALVTRFAAPSVGDRVLDLCAAPGGKALGLSESAGYVVAGDLSLRRLSRVRENAERLGVGDRVGLVVADARHPPYAPVDLVLLDAPCSGTGTLRRHPDGRWRVSPEQLAALVELQRELIDRSAELVRPGGCLVYSTCSLEAEENEMQVERFLNRHPDFAPDPPEGIAVETVNPRGYLYVLPQEWGVDGSFAARLRRRS